MRENSQRPVKKSRWRGATLQLLFVTVLPLTVLLLAVAFGSQTLHYEAMRSLVGDRDFRTVQAASSSLEREVSHLASTIQILSRSLDGISGFSSLILSPEEISSTFDGGIALYTLDDRLISASTTTVDWQAIPAYVPDFFTEAAQNNSRPVFSPLISQAGNSQSYILVGILTAQRGLLVGAFSPEHLIVEILGGLVSSGQITVLVISPSTVKGGFDVLYHSGPTLNDENNASHPGIQESLIGESGIDYYQSSNGEHVVAFSPVSPPGWGLITEEAWADIANPYLITTQTAPLIFIPAFLLALAAIWFGARRIVTPLQKLEEKAANLAAGDFEAIRQPVGGIEEIRDLQLELIDMADKLKAAQKSLHSYIGAITAGIENERRSLARELHDETIQALIALNLRIQLVLNNASEPQKAELHELQTLVQQSMTDLRRMVRGLRPIYLEDLGLNASLDMLVQEIQQTTPIRIAFTSTGKERRLDPQIEMSIYRLVQESLNNVIRHSEAKKARVELEFAESGLHLQIHDDGKGFTVPLNPTEFSKKGHFGLLGLQERSELIKAELKISSAPGQGTTISMWVQNPDSQNQS